MAHVVRPLMQQWSRWHYQCCCRALLHNLGSASPLTTGNTKRHRLFFTPLPSSYRSFHFRSRGLRLSNAPSPFPSYSSDNGSDSEGDAKKSRNVKKREARRAVRWGMELASFSSPQIRRILRVASLDQEVYDALMLVKRFGRDVREGKRRQFNYIGRLLREVEPELMDGLIQLTKDGDQEKFKALFGSEVWTALNAEDEPEAAKQEIEYEVEEEDSHHNNSVAARWFEGLVNKDTGIANEVYSVHHVEFDRQELRRLVRKVHSIQEREIISEEDEKKINAALTGAKRSLTRFLRDLAKQLATE